MIKSPFTGRNLKAYSLSWWYKKTKPYRERFMFVDGNEDYMEMISPYDGESIMIHRKRDERTEVREEILLEVNEQIEEREKKLQEL